ncbi:MAG: tyrosine-type recombinase/integrase [Pseudonocardiaceae bacterium]
MSGSTAWRASWPDRTGITQTKELPAERNVVAHVAQHVAGGLRYHDLRRAYATWLVSDGVPVNIVQTIMGNKQASTTLNGYTHTPDGYDRRVLAAFETSTAFRRLRRVKRVTAGMKKMSYMRLICGYAGGDEGN